MVALWTDPTAIDTYVTWQVAERVARRPLVLHGPPVPVIERDFWLVLFAEYILSLDVVDRLNAYSPVDYSGVHFPSCKHRAFAFRDANTAYDFERAIASFITVGSAPLPDLAEALRCKGRLNPYSARPSDVDEISPEFSERYVDRGWPGPEPVMMLEYGMGRTPAGGYSSDAAVRRGVLLNQARAAQQARSAAIEPALAAVVASRWAAARAAELALAQHYYPERGYT